MTDTQRQCLLTFLGYDTGGIGNGWGDKSRNAVEQVQEDLGLVPDGIWGPQTEAAVLEAVYTYDIDAPVQEDPEDPIEALFAGIRYWCPEEFRCRCGEYHAPYCDGWPNIPSRTLLELADDIRHRAGAPAHRSSALRCERHNRDSGGVYNSRHLTGRALDFCVEGMPSGQLLAMAQADPRTRYAYAIDGSYIHVDVD